MYVPVQVWAGADDDGILPVSSLTAGINTASLPVPATCALGCTANLLVAWPSTSLPDNLPVATVFDANAPVVEQAVASGGADWPVEVSQPVLQPELSLGGTASMVVEPSTNFTLTVDISECTSAAAASCGNALTEPAEVVVLAVDKAWLLLQPYELPDPAALFDVSLFPVLFSGTSTESNVNPAALSKWQQVCLLLRRHVYMPIGPNSTLISADGCVAVCARWRL